MIFFAFENKIIFYLTHKIYLHAAKLVLYSPNYVYNYRMTKSSFTQYHIKLEIYLSIKIFFL